NEVHAHRHDHDLVDGHRPLWCAVPGHRVRDAVAAEDGDVALAQPGDAGRVQACHADLARAPVATLVAAGIATGGPPEDVAGLDGHALALLRRFELGGEDSVARFEPGHAAQRRDIEDDAAADHAVAAGHDAAAPGAGRAHLFLRETVVHLAAHEDVAERVHM